LPARTPREIAFAAKTRNLEDRGLRPKPRDNCRSASQPSVTFDTVGACPGSLIVHTDGTVAGCTLDDDAEG
jgi:hypothetical protein